MDVAATLTARQAESALEEKGPGIAEVRRIQPGRPRSASEQREADRRLLEGVRAGRPAALRALVHQHQRAVFAVVSRTLGARADRALVEDLAQETFLRVFRAIGRFDPDGSARLSTWILRIATNLAIDELRRKRPVLEALPPVERVPERGAESGADRLDERRRIVERIDAALAELKPEFRAAFVLREFHGLEYREIATMLEIDLGTVKSRISRARTRLRAALKEHVDAR